MSNYPPFRQEQSVRLGAVVCVALVGLTLLAAAARKRGAAWWDYQPPIHPAADTPVQESHSRLLHWRAWSYSTPADAETVQAFYAAQLGAAGWQEVRETEARHARAKRYASGGLTLDVRTELTVEGRTQVGLLLTDLPPPSEG